MTIARFVYPGHGPNAQAYAGGLSPEVRRGIRRAGVSTRGTFDGPLFGRSIYDQPKDAYEFRWNALSHEEARSLYTQWEELHGGASPVYYTPDDQSEPITIIAVSPPEIVFVSAASASVTVVAEEQR